jgi:hypothetical protein
MGTTKVAAVEVDAVVAVSTLLIARTGNLGGIAVGIERIERDLARDSPVLLAQLVVCDICLAT